MKKAKNSPLKKKTSSTPSSVQSPQLKESFLIAEGEQSPLHHMIDHIGDEVVVLDKQARIVFVNKAAIKGLGYAKKDILQRSLTDFFEIKTSIRQWKRKCFDQLQQTNLFRILSIEFPGEEISRRLI